MARYYEPQVLPTRESHTNNTFWMISSRTKRGLLATVKNVSSKDGRIMYVGYDTVGVITAFLGSILKKINKSVHLFIWMIVSEEQITNCLSVVNNKNIPRLTVVVD